MTGRGLLPLLAVVVIVSACGGTTPTATPTERSRAPSPAASSTADASPTPDAVALPEPGRPYDAASVLEAMRDSRRPGGVPAELQTDAIAAEVAAAIWTIDGRPWERISAGGSCAADRCVLEVAGAHDGADGEDLWVFEVVPSGAEVRVDSVTLRSLPASLANEIDAAVRDAHPAPDERGLVLTAVRWGPPPADAALFELSYRTGNETGCALELVFDASAGEVVEESADGC